jgi:hypothetical protein
MSVQFKNIDSLIDNNSRTINVFNYYDVEYRLKEITKDFWNQNIYLVSPELMDVIYPPTKRKGINLDKVKVNDELFKLPTWSKYENQYTIAIGVYLANFKSSSYSDKLINFRSNNVVSDISNIIGSSIFICPERIMDCTALTKQTGKTIQGILNLEKEIISLEKDINLLKEANISSSIYTIEEDLRKKKSNFEKSIDYLEQEQKTFNTLLLKICLHEIAHHYMNSISKSNKKEKSKPIKVDKVVHKLIEESFANAFAWSQFSSPEELKIIESFMDSQPFEYSAYRYWIKDNQLKKCVPFLISSWKHKINPFIPEYLFEDIDEVLSDYYSTNSYKQIKEAALNFNFEERRSWNSTIMKLKDEKNFWEAIAKSMVYYFKTKRPY